MNKFITANGARLLSNETDAIIANILVRINEEIRTAAAMGATGVISHAPKTWISKSIIELDVKPDYIQVMVMDRLKSYGYSVSFGVHGTPYVPKGMAEHYDSSKGPLYNDWCIKIKW